MHSTSQTDSGGVDTVVKVSTVSVSVVAGAVASILVVLLLGWKLGTLNNHKPLRTASRRRCTRYAVNTRSAIRCPLGEHVRWLSCAQKLLAGVYLVNTFAEIPAMPDITIPVIKQCPHGRCAKLVAPDIVNDPAAMK